MEDGIKKDRDQKKNANTCKDSFCRRECLWNRYIRRKIVNREAFLIHTKPTASPSMAEETQRTFTVGTSQSVNLASVFCD